MAESLRCTLPVFLQSQDPGLVARCDGRACTAVSEASAPSNADVLQFVSSSFRRELRSFSCSPQKVSSREPRWAT